MTINTRGNRVLSGRVRVAVIALALAGSAWGADPIETCAGCHGKDGASTESDVPIIGGYSAKYLADSLTNYKNKARPCPEVKYNAGELKGQTADMTGTSAW